MVKQLVLVVTSYKRLHILKTIAKAQLVEPIPWSLLLQMMTSHRLYVLQQEPQKVLQWHHRLQLRLRLQLQHQLQRQ